MADLRSKAKAAQKQKEMLDNLYGLCLGEVYVYSEAKSKNEHNVLLHQRQRAFERVPGGWVARCREFYGKDHGNILNETAVFIPFKPKEQWDQ